MLISPAFAQSADGGGDAFLSFLPLILIFVVFYFLLIRPQQKKAKMHRSMVEALRRGDRVVTQGGVIGTVTKVISDGEVQVEIADGVRVRVVRGTISDVMAKTEPGKAKGDGGGKAASDDAKAAGGSVAEKATSGLSKLLGGGKKN